MMRAMTLTTLIVLAASVPSVVASSLDSIDPLIESHLGILGGGASLAIVQNGRVILRRHYGTFADETVVPIASASKWISAAVIMSVVDEGRLSLDDRVIKYIPSFSGDKSSITIRQLLSHTSGLPADSGLSSSGCLSDRVTTLATCAGEVSSQGAFGFSPWIDKERMLVGVLMVRSSLIQVMPVSLDLKQATGTERSWRGRRASRLQSASLVIHHSRTPGDRVCPRSRAELENARSLPDRTSGAHPGARSRRPPLR